MPSQFEQAVATNLDPLYGEFGIPGTYTPPSGAPSTITVRVHRGEVRQSSENGSGGEIQTGEILVRQAELAKPTRYGRFTVEGTEVWTIETTPIFRNGEFVCSCLRGGFSGLMERRVKDNA